MQPGDEAWAIVTSPHGRGDAHRRVVLDAALVRLCDVTPSHVEVEIVRGGRTIAGHRYRLLAADVYRNDAAGRAAFERAVRTCWAWPKERTR